jgi:hypothetical protein
MHGYRQAPKKKPVHLEPPRGRWYWHKVLLWFAPGILMVLGFIRVTTLSCDDSATCEIKSERVFGLFPRRYAYDVRTESLQYSGRKQSQLSVVDQAGRRQFSTNADADDAKQMMDRVNTYQWGRAQVFEGGHAPYMSGYQAFERAHASYTLSAGLLAVILLAAAYSFNRRWLVSVLPNEQVLVIRRNRWLFAQKQTVPFAQIAKVDANAALLGANNTMRQVVVTLVDARRLPMSNFVKVPIGVNQSPEFEALVAYQERLAAILADAGHRGE